MTTIEGVDYSRSRPGGAALKAAGKAFAVRYIGDPGGSTATASNGYKSIGQAEYDDLSKHGVNVVFVWEGSEVDSNEAMRKGHLQGIADATAAQQRLTALRGPSPRRPIYFACDYDAPEEDQVLINDYLDGVAGVIGRNRTGIYGGYGPVSRAKAAGKAAWFWQTYAWSGGKVLTGIHLYQYSNGQKVGGEDVDLTRALQSSYGQSQVILTPPAPKVPPLGGLVVFVRNAKTHAIYSFGPQANTLHHITAAEWKTWKAHGFKFTDAPPEAFAGYTIA